MNPGPLHWEHGVLGTGPPGKPNDFFDCFQNCNKSTKGRFATIVNIKRICPNSERSFKIGLNRGIENKLYIFQSDTKLMERYALSELLDFMKKYQS